MGESLTNTPKYKNGRLIFFISKARKIKVVLKCLNCDSYLGKKEAANFQDERYGRFMRVHTPISKDPKGSWWRCVLCHKERSSTDGTEAIEKKKKG
jgi:hypothetical protein